MYKRQPYDESLLKSKNALDIHEKIIQAMVDRDRERAVSLMKIHLREVGERLESLGR